MVFHQHQPVEQNVDQDIQWPYDIEDRQGLIDSFRKEILRDWINGIFELAGLCKETVSRLTQAAIGEITC
jgi:hypothetical protein